MGRGRGGGSPPSSPVWWCSRSRSERGSAVRVAGAADSSTTTTEPAGGWPKVDQPGVTDDEIRVSGVASTTNPIGGLYGTSFDGVQAYFDMINSQGGHLRPQAGDREAPRRPASQNAREVEAILDQDNVFAVLPVATIARFSGARSSRTPRCRPSAGASTTSGSARRTFFGAPRRDLQRQRVPRHHGALAGEEARQAQGRHPRLQRAVLGRLHRRRSRRRSRSTASRRRRRSSTRRRRSRSA